MRGGEVKTEEEEKWKMGKGIFPSRFDAEAERKNDKKKGRESIVRTRRKLRVLGDEPTNSKNSITAIHLAMEFCELAMYEWCEGKSNTKTILCWQD